MLDTTTKRRIDTARDILVGKVPDPKSQVEQITIALIYKFMDDMDAESEELGGQRKFFTGDYARYGWAKLMRSGLGGHELIGLYGEGITTMPQNPGIPALFRDIFKNAYLPYRDPETLKAFLKVIDEFSYDHSERLGDAFEYLLSVLGSQGDAGQFRTPRHIIDFMVEVLAPQKHETILDPACGTAGFLISAYKHILRTNTDAKGHSKLTPDEKGRLAKNFKGYDISPDMVRLSLVNLYLHGFTDPHIYEYDTLTSEERWNEFADVILANPPFMSPKGGIKPHKRFSIQAKRSEVLFVDYMAEHLTPNGRAAIIVPEGIIFQSQTAYKELRKMLVENSLVAVVSLPAGVFQPYSGVKTSILILDKSLARQSDTIAFFKVENDGFGLGAQRRAIEKNDLPEATRLLRAWLTRANPRESDQAAARAAGPLSDRAKGPPPYQPGATPQVNVPHKTGGLKARPIPRHTDEPGFQPSTGLGNHEPGALPQAGMDFAVGEKDTEPSDTSDIFQHPNFLVVPKPKIAANGDYNLSGERYREGSIATGIWPMVTLGSVATFTSGGTPSKANESFWVGNIPWVSAKDMKTDLLHDASTHISEIAVNESATKIAPIGSLLILVRGMGLANGIPICELAKPCAFNQDVRAIQPESMVNATYLRLMLKSAEPQFRRIIETAAHGTLKINTEDLSQIKIPLPPLEVQQEIVAEIEGYQKVINGARAVLDHYRPHIPIHPDWPILELSEVTTKITDGAHFTPTYVESGVPFLRVTDITESNTSKKFIPQEEHDELIKRCRPEKGDVLYSKNGTIGIAKLVDWDWEFSIFVSLSLIKPKKEVLDPHYLKCFLNSDTAYAQATARSKSGTVTNLHLVDIKTIKIPIPPLATQQAIVAEIEAEQALVAANRELITRFEQKIQATLARIWGEDSASANGAPPSQPRATPQVPDPTPSKG